MQDEILSYDRPHSKGKPRTDKRCLSQLPQLEKSQPNPVANLIPSGLVSYAGEKWDKHRKLLNPVLYSDKLKVIISFHFLIYRKGLFRMCQ